jgi:hypothetical protein
MRATTFVFGWTVKVTSRAPLPLGVPIVTHVAPPLVAVQAQPAGAVRLTDPPPPDAVNPWLEADSEYEHAIAAAAWFTLNTWPPTDRAPDLALVVVFAATENDAAPLPFPLPGDCTVSHDALLVAVHAHPLPTVTFRVPAPPVAAKGVVGPASP